MFGMIPWRKENGGKGVMEPFGNVRNRNDFRTLLERFFAAPMALAELPGWMAEVPWNLELKETEKEYIVRAEVPGFGPEEIEVKLLGDRLFIKAEHKEENKKEGEVEEKEVRRYEREVTLPAGVDAGKIEAVCGNGVLELHLPRTKETLGKTIPVKTAELPTGTKT